MKNFNITNKGAKLITDSNKFYNFFKTELIRDIKNIKDIKINNEILESKENFNLFLQDEENFNIVKEIIISYYNNNYDSDIEKDLDLKISDLGLPFCYLYMFKDLNFI